LRHTCNGCVADQTSESSVVDDSRHTHRTPQKVKRASCGRLNGRNHQVEKKVHAVRTTDKLTDAVAVLSSCHILCAPVVNPAIPQVVGLFSLADVCAYLTQKMMALPSETATQTYVSTCE
jgi:predicted transcriptional regulator